jgi:periplasmic protein CpxP/Spy
MIDPSKRRGTFAGVVALIAVLSIVPALAQTTPSAPPAAAPAAPSATPTPTPAKPPAKPASRRTYGIEARIKSLHARLHITAAQEPQWQQVAQAMRDNAASIDKMVRERNAKLRTMTAVENLQTYADIAEAHADGLKKLVPAFDNLYQSMSAAQKKDADAVFRSIAEHYAHRAAPKTAKPAAPAPK